MFFGNLSDFLDALANGKSDEYIDAMINKFDPVSIKRNASLVQNKVESIAEYLYWKGENTYILRYDLQPSVYIVFPKGIKNKKIYNKLYKSNFIDKRQDESIELMVYPRTEQIYNIIATILMSY